MVRIGLLQTEPVRLDREENYRAAARLAERVEADLLVLPELFDTGYLFAGREELQAVATPAPEGETCSFLRELARERGCHVAAGFAEAAGGKVYNAAALVGPEGEVGFYRKVHLFRGEKALFAPGEEGFAVHDLGFARVGLMICFDWVFPESARSLALQGAQLLLHPSNLVLPYCQRAMVTRSLENRVFSVTVNRTGTEQVGGGRLTFTGASQVVSPGGELLLAGPPCGEAALAVDVDPERALDKQITPENHLFDDRRPGLYTR
jgi:predicted amidohydrolase